MIIKLLKKLMSYGNSKVKSMTTQSLQVNTLIAPTIKKFVIVSGNHVFTAGDSITAYTGYSNMLAELTGTIQVNAAVGGRGAYRAVTNAYEMNPGNPDGWIATWMAGFNDYRRNASIETQLKCEGALRSFIVNSFIDLAVPANNCTKTGTWTTIPSGFIGDLAGHIGGNALFTAQVGATITTTFSGQTLAIGIWNTDGQSERGGTFSITIDGDNYGTYTNDGKTDGTSDGDYSNSRTQDTIVFKNLSSGGHTVTITIDSLAPGGYFYIDYFATLKSPQNCPTVLVYDIPKMNAAGYAEIPNHASDSVFDAGDAVQHAVIDFFKEYPVIRIRTNDAYDVNTGLGTDNIHPNLTGNAQILSVSLIDILQTQTTGSVPSTTSNNILNLSETDTPQTAGININNTVKSSMLMVGESYIKTTGSVLQISVNRDPRDGYYPIPSNKSPILFIDSNPNTTAFKFLIDDHVNGITNTLQFTDNGIEQAVSRFIYLDGGKENVDGSVRIGAVSGSFVWQKRTNGTWITQPF